MITQFATTGMVIATLTLGSNNLGVTPTETQTISAQNMTFVCAPQMQPPTMFAYTPGQVNLKPVMTWHKEYLLPEASAENICQQVAEKLQSNYQQGQQKFMAFEKVQDRTLVCLVGNKDDKCTSNNSEELFSLNPNYNPTCVMNNLSPLECSAVGQQRGSLMTLPSGTYEPSWWPWQF
jgi:hypothetical protein